MPAGCRRRIIDGERTGGMIKPGEEWGEPAPSDVPTAVDGDDAALADAVAAQPGGLFVLRSGAAEIGRAVGAGAGASTMLTLDALDVEGTVAVNMVVLGALPPRRWTRTVVIDVRIDDHDWFSGPATTVVVATGEFRNGFDVVPRGHPGDGRAEVQVYALRPAERGQLAPRMQSGAHVPHPRITQRSGRRIEIFSDRPLPLEIDGIRLDRVTQATVEVRPGAYRLLV
jgi:hypothetical protein